MCRNTFDRFVATFPETIRSGFRNVYAIASEGSLTSPEAYLRFCAQVGLPHREIEIESSPVRLEGCSLAVECDEAVADIGLLRAHLSAAVSSEQAVATRFATGVRTANRSGDQYELIGAGGQRLGVFDAVVNCSYADINRITAQLGHHVPPRQFEYTFVPIVEVPIPPVGATIMDGPFMTLLPYGKSGAFTLYHVTHSVIDAEVSTSLHDDWLDPETAPLQDKEAAFKVIRQACSQFLPALRDARLAGVMEGPRMVVPYGESSDRRPSLVEDYGNGYLTVFSGKIDHCLSIADNVSGILSRLLRHDVPEAVAV